LCAGSRARSRLLEAAAACAAAAPEELEEGTVAIQQDSCDLRLKVLGTSAAQEGFKVRFGKRT
jgi:hypothetical protein